MLKRKTTLAILAVLISLSSCAALQITTWTIKQGELVHGLDKKSIAEGEGFRCYSEPDDAAWRNELKIQSACCNGWACVAGS